MKRGRRRGARFVKRPGRGGKGKSFGKKKGVGGKATKTQKAGKARRKESGAQQKKRTTPQKKRATPQKGRKARGAEEWRAPRRITDLEMRGCVEVLERVLEGEQQRVGVSLEDLAGAAGVSRQCIGKAKKVKNSQLFSTVLSRVYALNLDWCFLEFDREGLKLCGSAGGGKVPLQLHIQMGRGRAKVSPCHRNR